MAYSLRVTPIKLKQASFTEHLFYLQLFLNLSNEMSSENLAILFLTLGAGLLMQLFSYGSMAVDDAT